MYHFTKFELSGAFKMKFMNVNSRLMSKKRKKNRFFFCLINRIIAFGAVSYLVYIANIAILTTSCRYRLHIGTRSFPIYIVLGVDIAMFTISCQYRVEIGILSFLVYIVDIPMLIISCRYHS